MFKSTTFIVDGIAPILMHNGRLADPLDQYAQALKEVSGKRKKTESDHAEMSRIEWLGGVYFSDDLGLYMPGLNLESAIVAAAKKIRSGPAFKAGIIIEDAAIEHKGPKKLDALQADKRFTDRRAVRVQQNRIMRTRPKVPPPWSMAIVIQWNEDLLSKAQLAQVVDILGAQVGVGDYIPKHGRFTVRE